MARIDPKLLQRLVDKLGVSPRSVYRQVENVVHETMLERELAALVLASRNKINITPLSTPEQRRAISGVYARPITNDIAAPATGVRPAPTRGGARKVKPVKKTKSNSVFVVHGRDEELRKSMFAFLRALGLKPMEWAHAVQEAKGANPYVGEIINTAMSRVQAVVVLLSPDELALLKEQFCKVGEKRTEGKLQGQPRPNVLFEAGLALGAHPEKTLLVQVGKVRSFSDIAGKHLVKLTDGFEKRNELANRLQKIGCAVNRTGTDWTTEGTFVPTEPKVKNPTASAKVAR